MAEAKKTTATAAKKAAAPAPTTAPVPTPPVTWSNIPADIAYVVAVALFIIGVLTSAGVVIPDSVSHNIQVWAGVATQIAGVATALINNIAMKSVQKTIIKSNGQIPAGTKLR